MITEKQSSEVVWYINGKMAPEIHVERGKTYIFVVEGGKEFSKISSIKILKKF